MRDIISKLEKEAESRALSGMELSTRSNCLQKISEFEMRLALDFKQKARVKWVADGDENSKFFHGYVNNNKRKNIIVGLMINGRWLAGVKDIKAEAFCFVQNKFMETWISRPKLINSNIHSIDMMDAKRLEAPISMDEVKNAIWSCGGDKAPGPDGLTFKLLKRFWSCFTTDVMKFIQHFEESGSLARGCNSSFITLAPKVNDPSTLSDYKPISLIGCMYKIISKIVATRLKAVVGKVVGEVQPTYVEGRSILDGPLIVNDICGWAKSIKKKILLFKADYDRAFDSINWEYLDSILTHMGFGTRWRSWIRGCLEFSRASVVVNGSPTKEFNITKGVRQGDPYHLFYSLLQWSC